MKKILILLVGLVFAFIGIAHTDSSSVSFTWDANTEEDLASYRLYQSQTSGVYVDPFIEEIPAGTETVTITGLAPGTYYWVLTAYDTEDLESEYSNEVTKHVDGSCILW